MFQLVNKYKLLVLIYFLCSIQIGFAFEAPFMPTISEKQNEKHSLVQTMAQWNLTAKTKRKSFHQSIQSKTSHSFSLSILPPTHLSGRQITNKFATQIDRVNHMSWRAPKGGTPPVAYQIYRDAALTQLVAIIPADAKLKFNDHHRKKHHTYVYFIVSEDVTGQFSLPIGIEFRGSKMRLIPTTLQSIVVTPIDSAIAAGQTLQFMATGLFSHGITLDITNWVTWTSSNSDIAEINSVGLAEGLITGTAVITASFGSVSTSTLLTVTPSSLIAIEISPLNFTLPIKFNQQFTAIGIFSDGAEEDLTSQVTWSSSNPGIATINPTTGLTTGISSGLTTITANLGGTSFIASTTLTISSAILTNIFVLPSNPSIPIGISQQFTATGAFDDSSTLDITTQVIWSSSAPAVATITASSGLAQAVSPGSTSITATLGAIFGSTTLTVTTDTLINLIVSPANTSTSVGLTEQFTATGIFTDGTERNITTSVIWTSSNPNVASIDPKTGLVSALKIGSTAIRATLGAIDNSTSLTVTGAVLKRIRIFPRNPAVFIGENPSFIAIGIYDNGTTKEITTQVNWTSSEPQIATIGRHTGLARARTSGDTKIRAHLNGIHDTTTLHVTSTILQSIEVFPPNATIYAGFTEQFTAIGTYSNGSTQDITSTVTWTSNIPTIASIDSNGVATGHITGISTITASLQGIAGFTSLNISSATLTDIVVAPATPTIPQNTSQQFEAIGIFSDTTSKNITSLVNWSSSNSQVATIQTTGGTQPGLAMGLDLGTSNITAQLGAISDSTTLTVSTILLQISISPSQASIGVDFTQQFIATGTFSDGSTQDITDSVNWMSFDPSIALINSDSPQTAGLAIGISVGMTQITATLGGVTSSAAPLSVSAVLQSIVVIPTNNTVPSGINVQFTAIGIFSDGSTQDITDTVSWSSSQLSVATIQQDGQASPGLAETQGSGSTLISATHESVVGTTTLNVNNAQLVSIAITPANSTMSLFSSQQFMATGTYTDGSQQDLTKSVTWVSLNQTVASISSSGLATALSAENTTIQASLTLSSGSVISSTSLTVSGSPLVFISITPVNSIIAINTSQQFTATGLLDDTSTLDITNFVDWGSSDGSVATISQSGLASAFSNGSTTISASLQGVVNTVPLQVTPATLQSITISPSQSQTIFVGNTLQFTATGSFSDGSTQNITNDVLWQILPSGNTSAILQGPGLIAAVSSPGGGALSATAGNISSQTNFITITMTLSISPSSVSIPIGQHQQFKATATFPNSGTSANFTDLVTWVSSDPTVVIIGSNGEAIATGLGLTAYISATYQNIQAPEATFHVENNP